MSSAGDEMTRGKREQRSSGIRGPRKQDPEHGREEVLVEREKAMGRDSRDHIYSGGNSTVNLLFPFHHVHAHYAAPSTTLVPGTHCSLSNCDHAASQLLQTMSMMASFTAAQALKLYCLFMKAGLLDKTDEPPVCFLVACRLVHY